MIKAIATDLDGTLFYPKTKKNLIYKKNKEFLRKFISNGGDIIAVTGRNFSIKKNLEAAIEMKDSLSFVGCNGSIVIHKNEIVEEHEINKETALEIYNHLTQNKDVKIIFFMGNDGIMHLDVLGGKLMLACAKLGFKLQGAYKEPVDFGRENILKVLNDPNYKLYKIMPAFGFIETEDRDLLAIECLDDINRHFTDVTCAATTTALEITAKGVNKGAALRNLIKLLGYEKEEVAVAGDSGNDVAMFKEFPHSFAMKHARKEVRKEAKNEIFYFHEIEKHINK